MINIYHILTALFNNNIVDGNLKPNIHDEANRKTDNDG